MDESTRTELRTAHDWASDLANDECQDRTLILEGLLKMIDDISEGTLINLAAYNRRYTYGR